VAKEKIEKILMQFRRRGFDHITFTGGEPTLHPHIIDILKFAGELRYTTYITSNGGLFSLKRFTRRALPYLDEICFSLYGHNAGVHNFHTANKESFGRLLRALRNVEDLPENISGFVNIVMTRHNFDFLGDIINLLGPYKKIRQVLISNFAPEGNGLRNFKELVVRLSDIKEKIGGLARAAYNNSLIVRFFGMPLCILDGFRDFSNDLHWSPRATIELRKAGKKAFLKKTLSYKPVRERIKTGRCNSCLEKEKCGGLFKKYYNIFGDRELKPI